MYITTSKHVDNEEITAEPRVMAIMEIMRRKMIKWSCLTSKKPRWCKRSSRKKSEKMIKKTTI